MGRVKKLFPSLFPFLLPSPSPFTFLHVDLSFSLFPPWGGINHSKPKCSQQGLHEKHQHVILSDSSILLAIPSSTLWDSSAAGSFLTWPARLSHCPRHPHISSPRRHGHFAPLLQRMTWWKRRWQWGAQQEGEGQRGPDRKVLLQFSPWGSLNNALGI